MMPSSHAVLDEVTARLSARVVGEHRFFARSVDAPRVEAVLPAVTLEGRVLDDSLLDGRTRDTRPVVELAADTPVGVLDPAVQVWRWVGPDAPTLVYHHGSGERPFAPRRFSPDSFRDVVTTRADRIRGNVLAVRAPYHADGTDVYARAMGDLANFVAMLATSVATVEHLVRELRGRGRGPVVVSGVSLGGWVTNLHRTYRGSADAYVPMLAGAALGDMFLDTAYRRLLGPAGRADPDAIRRTLNFGDDFLAADGPALAPLLARHDRYVAYDVQRRCYRGHDVAVVDRGHVTSLARPGPLTDHLVAALDRLAPVAAVDTRGPRDAPAVVFVHGAGISRKLWLPQTEALADACRTVAPDLPGHGARADEPFDFAEAVDTVAALVRDLAPTCVVLVGQSLGGYVATEVAARHPDAVAGLVLSGSSADYRGVLGLRTAAGSHLMRLGARSRFVEDWFGRRTAATLRSRPISARAVEDILDAGVSLDAWGQSGLALVGHDFPSRLAAYDGPVRLVNGADDRLNRAAARRLSADDADVTAVVVRGAGHTVSLERPEAYTDVIREFVAEWCPDGTAPSADE